MLEKIKRYFDDKKVPKYRFKQLEDAIFNQFVGSFEEITTFPKKFRDELSSEIKFGMFDLVEVKESGDSVKFVLKTEDGYYVESVLMKHNDGRRTVCVSSQIFCAMGCVFCATGANKFRRNLSADEIIEQVLFVARYLKSSEEKVTNVVFMGMGEPFLNYENVVESVRILNDEMYFNIGARHITVSTVGIVPRIYDFAKLGLQVRLAISLHAPNDKLRSSLMPVNKKYDISELIAVVDDFIIKTNKRVSFEYVLIKDVNDSMENAVELAGLLKGRLVHVNLLYYNPHEFAKFEKSDEKTMLKFKEVLDDFCIECSIRKSLGDDIAGACGQLAGKR